MAVIVAHEPSSLFLGEGLTLVERADAIEFESAQHVQTLLERMACDLSFVVQPLVACSAA